MSNLLLDGGLYGRFEFNTQNYIGKGNFGTIFKGRNMNTYEEVAIKIEPIMSLHLLKEDQFYTILGAKQRFHGIQGLPEIYYTSNIGLNCTAMAIELLGPSLNDLFKLCKNKFTLKTVLMIAIQTISRIEYIHSRKLIHRDIKPENFLIGLPQQSLPYKPSTEHIIHLIDFGMANEYIDPVTGTHILFKKQAGVFGTYQFMSANAHWKIEQSRRDDLEALGYMLIYFLNGTLPWMKFLEDNYDLYRCGIMKQSMTVDILCKDLPREFGEYFNYVKQLGYYADPDYGMLKKLFSSSYGRNRFPNDKLFDWSNILDRHNV